MEEKYTIINGKKKFKIVDSTNNVLLKTYTYDTAKRIVSFLESIHQNNSHNELDLAKKTIIRLPKHKRYIFWSDIKKSTNINLYSKKQTPDNKIRFIKNNKEKYLIEQKLCDMNIKSPQYEDGKFDEFIDFLFKKQKNLLRNLQKEIYSIVKTVKNLPRKNDIDQILNQQFFKVSNLFNALPELDRIINGARIESEAIVNSISKLPSINDISEIIKIEAQAINTNLIDILPLFEEIMKNVHNANETVFSLINELPKFDDISKLVYNENKKVMDLINSLPTIEEMHCLVNKKVEPIMNVVQELPKFDDINRLMCNENAKIINFVKEIVTTEEVGNFVNEKVEPIMNVVQELPKTEQVDDMIVHEEVISDLISISDFPSNNETSCNHILTMFNVNERLSKLEEKSVNIAQQTKDKTAFNENLSGLNAKLDQIYSTLSNGITVQGKEGVNIEFEQIAKEQPGDLIQQFLIRLEQIKSQTIK